MRHILALGKRELIAYFLSPIGYIVGFLFIGLYNVFFYAGLNEVVSNPRMSPDANAVLIGAVSSVNILALFAIPFLTMNLPADEKRSGTIEMLMTAPVRDWEVVLGKYLGSVIFTVCLIVPSAAHLIAVRIYGLPAWGNLFTAYLGMVLMVLFLLAFGLFFSSISKSPLASVMLSFVAFLTLLILGAFIPETPPVLEAGTFFANVSHYLFAFLRYASLSEHYMNFFYGLVNTRDVIYFVSGTVFFLFLSTLAVESRKWK